MKKLPNKPNETYINSCIRKADVFDYMYESLQRHTENPLAIFIIEMFEEANQHSIEEE